MIVKMNLKSFGMKVAMEAAENEVEALDYA